MRCPTCGKWNRTHYERCMRCGVLLNAPHAGKSVPPFSEDALQTSGSETLDPVSDTIVLSAIARQTDENAEPEAHGTGDGHFDPAMVLAQLMRHRKTAAPIGQTIHQDATSAAWFAPRSMAQKRADREAAKSDAEPVVIPSPEIPASIAVQTNEEEITADSDGSAGIEDQGGAVGPFISEIESSFVQEPMMVDTVQTAEPVAIPSKEEEPWEEVPPATAASGEVIDASVLRDAQNLMREIRPFAWERMREVSPPERIPSAVKRAARSAQEPARPYKREERPKQRKETHPKRVDVQIMPPLKPTVLAKHRPSVFRRLFVALFWLILIGGICFGGYHGYRWIVGLIPPSEQDQRPAVSYDDSIALPLIETGTYEDKPARILTFFGDEGDFVFLPEFSSKNHPFVGGKARITIPDAFWIGDDPADDQESIAVTLNPKIITVSGEEKLMAPVEYSVDVPLSQLELIEPSERVAETYQATQRVQIQVSPGSSVYINDDLFSDLVSKDGLLSVTRRVESSGDNVYEISVKTPGCRTNRISLIVRRPYMDIPIEVAPPDTANVSNVTIHGSTEAGASITVATPHSSLEQDASTGSFSFTARLERVGANDVTIIANKEGREESQLTLQISYEPEIGEYSSRAWKFADEYKNLLVNASSRIGQIYKVDGRIIQIIQTENPMLIEFDGHGITDTSMPLYFEYRGDKEWLPDKDMVVYAHVIGEREGLPLLEARFIQYP